MNNVTRKREKVLGINGCLIYTVKQRSIASLQTGMIKREKKYYVFVENILVNY